MAFTASLFGRHIGGSAENLPVHGHRDLARLPLGQTEIHQMRLTIPVKHDIGRFEITVDHSMFVSIVGASAMVIRGEPLLGRLADGCLTTRSSAGRR